MFRASFLYLVLITCLTAVPSFAQEESPSYEHLKELSDFLGEWEASTTVPAETPPSEKLGQLAGRSLQLTSSFRWAPGKCALVADYRYELQDAPPILATSLIGWDQNREEIVSYEYTTQNGVWSAAWKKEGDRWISSFQGTDLDGAKHTGKSIFEFKDQDHYTVHHTEQTKDGKSIPDAETRFARKGHKSDDGERLLAAYEKEFLGRWLNQAPSAQAIPGFAAEGDLVTTIIEIKAICEGLYVADSHKICGDRVGIRSHFVFGWDSVGQQIQGRWFDETGTRGYINYRFDGNEWSGDGSTIAPDGSEVKSEFDIEITDSAHIYRQRNVPPGPEGAGRFLRQ